MTRLSGREVALRPPGTITAILLAAALAACVANVSDLPRYAGYTGRWARLDRDYYLYELNTWPRSYELENERMPRVPGVVYIDTLPAGTAVELIAVRRMYAPTPVDRLVASAYVPVLGREVRFEYLLGMGSALETSPPRLDWLFQ